jgi:endonuclease YncB( thermonuclease family)
MVDLFPIGTPVEKVGGSYGGPGVVRGHAVSETGEARYLVGIDAPEVGTHARCPAEATAGLEAKAALAGLIRRRPVEVIRTGVDRYHRTLARLSVDGHDVDAAMLAAGAALPYRPGRAAWADRCRHWCPGATRCEE